METPISYDLHGFRGPYRDVHGRAGYFWKNPHRAKMTENGQKWPETGILDFLRKSSHYFSLERV